MTEDARKIAVQQMHVVRKYLNALESAQPTPKKATPDKLQERLVQIRAELEEPMAPYAKLKLRAEIERLEKQLAALTEAAEANDLEDRFVEIAADYSAREDISYNVWREMGVPADVLQRANIRRTR